MANYNIDAIYNGSTSLPGTERVRIDGAGNIGIGASTPLTRLFVSGSSSVNENLPTTYIRNSFPGTHGYGLSVSRNGSDTSALCFGSDSSLNSIIASNNTDLRIGKGQSNTFTEYIRVNTNGNVGIGTSSPNTLLNVHGTNPFVRINNTSASDHGIKISYNNSDTHGLHLIYNPNFATSYIDNTYPTAAGQVYGDIYFRQNVGGTITTRMTIKADGGNVGIGTTSPLGRLHLNSTTSGATLLRADGTNGTLFSVIDDLSDSLMSVNNSAGLPVLEVFADDRIVAGQYGQNDFVVRNNKVGIGTSNPIHRLQLGNFTSTSTATPETINLGGTFSNSAGSNIKLRVYDDGAGNYVGMSVSSGQAEINTWNTGKIAFYRGTTQSAIIDANGNLGIGSASPGYKLDVNGTFRTATNNLTIFNDYIYVSPTNNNTLNSAYAVNGVADMWINFRGYNDGQTQFRNFNIGDGRGSNIAWFDGTNKRMSLNNGQAASYTLHVVGTGYFSSDLTTAGTLTESSSIRYKENVKTLEEPILDKLNKVRPVTYNKKDNKEKNEYGIIAEELHEIFPEFVNKNEEGEIESVNYSRLTVLLLKAVKELQEEVNQLKNK